MKKQPNYTCMLKNLLKLYCIWTWDTLWGFFVCVQFCSTLCIPFDETTTEQHLMHHLQDWRLRDKHQNYWDWNFITFELGGFFFYFSYCFISFYLYIFFFHLLIFIFILIFILFIFYFQSSLCLSNAYSAYDWLVHYLSLFISLKLFCLILCFVFSYFLFICFSLFL
jgi:hypothetical protein